MAGPVGVFSSATQRAYWAAPLYLRMTDLRTEASASMLLPLYYARRSNQGTAVHTLLGFGTRGVQTPAGRSWSFGVHPLLTYAGRRDDGGAHVVAAGGLFWRQTRPESATIPALQRWGVGPLFYHQRRGERLDLGVPGLVMLGRNGTRRYQGITPLFWHVKDSDPAVDRSTWVLGPAYSHRLGKDRQLGLAPVYFGRFGGTRRWHVIPPLLTAYNADDEAGTSQLITPLFTRSTGPDARAFSVLWLGWDARRGDERDSVLFPLYYRRQRGDTTWWATPLGGMKRSSTGAGWVVGPAYGYRRDDAVGFGVAPLVFRHQQVAGDNPGVTSVVFPFWARSRHVRADVDMYTPLVWRARM